MVDEIDPVVIQRTQQKLGKYIQRPQLTDKLLKRPPFRFIHDIITAVINQYGILENVFTKQELLSENIKEKEDKIAFLQKFISHISSELGQSLNVKPSKIVAGIEAEKTNDLLQALALMLENKQNSNSKQKNSNTSSAKPEKKAVKKSIPLAGTTSKENNVSRSTAKTDAINRQAPNTNKTKDVAKSGVSNSNKPSQLSSSSSKPALPNKTTNSSKFEEAKRDPGASSNKKPDNNTSKSSVNKPTSSASVKMNNSSRNVKDTTVTPRSSRSLERSQQQKQENIDEETIADMMNVSPPDYSISNVDEEPVKETSALPTDGFDKSLHVSPDFPSIDSGITIEQPLDTSTIRPLKSLAARDPQDEGFGIDDLTETQEPPGMLPSRIAQLSPPQTNILNAFEKPIPNRSSSPNLPLKRPASGSRPKSSRRPPSRTSRDRLSVIQQDSRPVTGQVPRVIIEGNPMSDDEEDRIVQAAVFDQATADLSQAGADEFMAGEQGKLVEQILSAQREWDPLSDMESSNKDSGSSSAQVQHLKSMIQDMAQAALPLGQLIPLIHEDMETVHQEWQFWKREADLLEEEYQREKTSIDSVVEKLQAELEQLDRVVLEHQTRLNTAKASVLKTEKDVSLVISNFGKKR